MRDVYLEEVAQLTVGHVGSMVDEYVDVGIPFLRSLNIQPHRIDFQETKFITRTFHEKLRKSALRPNDVVIVRTGKPGTCAVIPEDLVEANCSDLVIVRCGPHIRPRFLAYWVNAVASEHVASHIVGAVQQHFNVGSAKRMPIRLPSLRDQDNVLAILGTLDDKIELNRKTAATLEAMARALYRSWFVDFDPVRARAEGRAPAHMDAATAALFPDSFGEDGLPVGWQCKRIASLAECKLGGTPSRSKPEYWGGDVPWINSGAVNSFRITAPSELITQAGLDGSSTKILPQRTTLVAITGATLGQVSINEIEICANQSVVGIVSEDPLKELIYLGVTETIDDLIKHQTGGAQQHINKGNVEDHTLVCADADICSAFAKKIRPVFDKVASLEFQNTTLATLRDTLLPRLMSGELRVGAAREMIEEVA